MAEGVAREYGQGLIEACSAGLMTADVQPRAIEVMKEIGIDISHQHSKLIDPALLLDMDVVITLCDVADAACLWIPPSMRRFHWPVKDPVGARGTEDYVMGEFRRARDEIRDKILHFIEEYRR
jgi:arsenate reductase